MRKESVFHREWQWGSRSQAGSEREPTDRRGRMGRTGIKSLPQREPG